jgi:hypothetical protein
MKTLETQILEMLTENTGEALCDSGGAYGRHWQKNQGSTIEALEAMPSATLEIWHSENFGYEVTPTINVYHFLRDSLALDDLCQEFNAMPVEDWDSERCGLSRNGEDWLHKRGFTFGGSGNTYNWDSYLSQVLQYTNLHSAECISDEWPDYVLLQIHGGCDVRGGYTDAKLFAVDCDYFPYENCRFSVETDIDDKTPDIFTGQTRYPYLSISWSGEWINDDGGCADDDDIEEFAKLAFDGRESEQSSVTIEGDSYIS